MRGRVSPEVPNPLPVLRIGHLVSDQSVLSVTGHQGGCDTSGGSSGDCISQG